ncbi:MAG: cysteine desulfurase family protein [Clostridia bacterium]
MIYLDNSATTRTFDDAAQMAEKYMTQEFFNPAGAYSPAVAAERNVNAARERIADIIGASKSELIFTSGGTESNNMAIFGTLRALRGKGRIIVSAVEHPSVYVPIMNLEKEYDVTIAGVKQDGSIDVDALGELITPETQLVSIMHVNNETGAINDIAAINRLLKRIAPDAYLHVDGVQAFIKVPMLAGNCDLYSISGHKFHGPKGVGALYVKSGVKFIGGQMGGGQENDLRSGTTNTPGIMGMDTAAAQYIKEREAYVGNMRKCKEHLHEALLNIPDVIHNGPELTDGAPHILNMSFLGVRGEVLLHALEEKSIFVSTGSACAAHKKGKNRILTAMGITGERQEGAIRFSLCPFNTIEEMDITANAIDDILKVLRRFKRR